MSLKSDLIAAKALIDTPEKWRKHSFGEGSGPFCAMGAARKVAGDIYEARFDAMRLALMAKLPWGYTSVSRWNDRKARTHGQVMKLFDRAIAAAGDA
jgi:hypothetical protein